MEQIAPPPMDGFLVVLYLNVLLKSAEKVSFKTDQNNGALPDNQIHL
jgi:hypothetical protein